ncbi:hypothetical protein [Nocardia sp. NPDC051463]|uniref:hypothetical protein n=1 Tax=Nocardia sp. NPDC051463 TaxID=3154845 RepID=UPI0034317BCC
MRLLEDTSSLDIEHYKQPGELWAEGIAWFFTRGPAGPADGAAYFNTVEAGNLLRNYYRGFMGELGVAL